MTIPILGPIATGDHRNESVAARLERWRRDPVAFVADNFEIDTHQKELLRKLVRSPVPQVRWIPRTRFDWWGFRLVMACLMSAIVMLGSVTVIVMICN